MHTPITAFAIAGLLTVAAASADPLPQANDSTFKVETADLAAKLALMPNVGRAKNVILFIGDGMGVTTVTAARIYQGQKAGRDGASNRLAMEKLPYGGLSRTFSSDALVTDSAPSAVSMTTGVKTRNGTLGMNQNVVPEDCAKSKGTDVTTIFEMAEKVGLSTGIVSTARITHATPASAYAHAAGRDWESDADLPAAAKAAGCKDIADQLVHWNYGNGFEVILGGGRTEFFTAAGADAEHKGKRTDGRDLVGEWLTRYNAARPGSAAYVANKSQFDALDLAKTRHVMGLFNPSHMQFEIERERSAPPTEPSLTDMTLAAIRMLKSNSGGYVLMVEGGRIDHAHHAGMAGLALEETLAFDAAIAAAVKATDPRDTLIVVTADHSHTLTFSGYSSRKTPILGLVTNENGQPVKALDGKPFTQLGYANGPGAVPDGQKRADLTDVDTTAMDFHQQSLVPTGAETHGGEDVPIFASGPFAWLFSGAVDENFTYHVIAKATDIPARAGMK